MTHSPLHPSLHEAFAPTEEQLRYEAETRAQQLKAIRDRKVSERWMRENSEGGSSEKKPTAPKKEPLIFFDPELVEQAALARQRADAEFLLINPHLQCKDPIERSIAERKGKENLAHRIIDKVENSRGTFYPEWRMELVGPPCEPPTPPRKSPRRSPRRLRGRQPVTDLIVQHKSSTRRSTELPTASPVRSPSPGRKTARRGILKLYGISKKDPITEQIQARLEQGHILCTTSTTTAE